MILNKIENKDCLIGLKELPDQSIDCCITSPPYFGLRDYGVEGQIGLEETPELFVAKMVEVFTEVKRVLKKEGTLWLNLGDSYNGSGKGGNPEGSVWSGFVGNKDREKSAQAKQKKTEIAGLKPKDLIGVPWAVAFALRSSGWYLRQDIIWHKPNPMPESVTDRCTKAHEYIFLLSKSQKYYYDAESIKQESIWAGDPRIGYGRSHYRGKREGEKGTGQENFVQITEMANKRSVWTVTTKPFAEAHFATFPEDLIVDCIKAGCHENGVVLDPFMGAGTTALVASKLNRNFIGFELNAEYIKIAEKRLRNQLGMFNPMTV